MTTNTFSSFLDHTSTAGFRQWGSELGASFATVGLVQTADTGQINWTTVTVPGINTVAGYEIWRFADSSLFMKFEYGTAASATSPIIFLTVGSGSNGSGSITGQSSTRNSFVTGTSASSLTTNYPSYVCHVSGAFTLIWKAGGSTVSGYQMGAVAVGKTVDNAGSPTTIGYGVLRESSNTGNFNFQSVRLAATSATNNDTTNFIVFPGAPSSSQTGSNVQAYLLWMNVHQVAPFEWAVGYLLTEQLKLTPFTLAAVSTTSHTYMPIGQLGASGALNGQSVTVYSLAFIYE